MKSLPKKSGIYVISTPGGSTYVGSAKNIHVRWRGHRCALLRRTHVNNRLQDAWDKYGDGLEVRALLLCEKQALFFYEQRAINVLRPNLNISKTATGGNGGAAGPWFGKKLSEDHRRKLSIAHLGNRAGMLGRHHSAMSRAKMSAIRKARAASGDIKPFWLFKPKKWPPERHMQRIATDTRRQSAAQIARCGIDFEVQA